MLHINLAKPLVSNIKINPPWDTPTNIDFWGYYRHLKNGVVVSPAGPPQSLGELCLELNEDAIRFHTRLHYAFAGDDLMRFYTAMFIATACLNARDLRRTLYHRRGTKKGHPK